MTNDIQEKDWKIVRDLQKDTLNTACGRILQRAATLTESRGSESHQNYLKLYKLMRQEDKQISLMFDDFKRSNAIFKLAMWRKNDLLPDEVFNALTEETREHIQIYNEL